MPDTDFQITDEEVETPDTETAVHAGDAGDGEGDGTPDRGDAVTPGTGEEGDPAAAGEGGEGEGGPNDPEFLQRLAGEGDDHGTPKVVPYARVAQLSKQNMQLMELLDGFATGRIAPGTKQAAAAAAETPAFDMKAKQKEYGSLLLEGDEDKAAAVMAEIMENQSRMDRAAARAEAMADFEAAHQKRSLDTIVSDSFDKYPFLDSGSDEEPNPDYNPDALDEVMMYRNHYMTKGDSLPMALSKAIEKVCPQYVEGGDGGEAPAKPAAARDAGKILRNARAARSQPPETARAGTANRESIDVSKLDIEHMPDDKFDALPADVKARIRGDAVA